MGNCLMRNKILVQNEDPNLPISSEGIYKETEKTTASSASANGDGDGEKKIPTKKKKKKVVRFKLDEENDGDAGKQEDSKNEVVRIRVVLTQKELKQILSSRKDLKTPSMEQLMRFMKMRGIRVSEGERFTAENDGCENAWRPELESIPEEH